MKEWQIIAMAETWERICQKYAIKSSNGRIIDCGECPLDCYETGCYVALHENTKEFAEGFEKAAKSL